MVLTTGLSGGNKQPNRHSLLSKRSHLPPALNQLQDLMDRNAYQRIIQEGYSPETAASLVQLGRGQRY
uniref:Uncharacterized protein n=1 Tax=viral metagenome TaxID=1070528 RepID=A0A6C0J264_9ZZZZ